MWATYCYHKLQILENNKNSVATHSSFYTVVHMICVYGAVSRNRIYSNLSS